MRWVAQDLNQFYAQYKSVEPWLKQKKEHTDMTKENLQTKEDRAKLVRAMWRRNKGGTGTGSGF